MTRIQQASPADAAVLANLNLHVHRLHLEHASRFFVQPTDIERQAAFAELLSQSNVRAFIAYVDKRAVGYVLAHIDERAAGVFTPARRWLYVDQISVEPEWEGRGIGRQLVTSVVEYARSSKVDELEADVWAFNQAAQEFFEAVGFRPKIERFWMHLDE